GSGNLWRLLFGSPSHSGDTRCHPERSEQRERSRRISDRFAQANPVPVPRSRSAPSILSASCVILARRGYGMGRFSALLTGACPSTSYQCLFCACSPGMSAGAPLFLSVHRTSRGVIPKIFVEESRIFFLFLSNSTVCRGGRNEKSGTSTFVAPCLEGSVSFPRVAAARGIPAQPRAQLTTKTPSHDEA